MYLKYNLIMLCATTLLGATYVNNPTSTAQACAATHFTGSSTLFSMTGPHRRRIHVGGNGCVHIMRHSGHYMFVSYVDLDKPGSNIQAYTFSNDGYYTVAPGDYDHVMFESGTAPPGSNKAENVSSTVQYVRPI
jgi:hypothetical protein